MSAALRRVRFVDLGGGRGLALEEGRVAAVDVPVPGGEATLDGAGLTLEPGAVCAHTHLYSGLAPLGLPAPWPPPRTFVEILERVWWRLDRALDAASLRASARYYLAQAALAGTTTLVDHHESPGLIEGSLDLLAGAAEEIGLRLLTCYGATERNGGREEARRGLAECARFLRDRCGGLVAGAVALHASFTVSDETVREAGALCRDLGAVLHVHLAEDRADVEDARRRGYEGPLQRLEALGALPEGSILAHGVHLTAREVERAGDLGAWLVQNPRSNEGNRVGYPGHLARSARVALGTDGYPAVMQEEAARLLELAEAHGPEERAAAGRRLEAGQRLAAERFGGVFGEIAPGAAADLVLRDASGAVRHVVVDGRLVVEDGALRGADLGAIEAEARREAEVLWARLPPDPAGG